MTRRLRRLAEQGMLRPIDVHFATAMGRIGGEANSDVLLAAALVSHQLSRGHVCVGLHSITSESLGFGRDALQLPLAKDWMRLLEASPLTSNGQPIAPLVLDARGYLYFHRYWKHEQVLASYIRSGAMAIDESVDGGVLKEGLDRLFPTSGDAREGEDNYDFQRLSALIAVRRRFCVISGGPGTGKTHTVVSILALLVEQALHVNRPAPQITLVAPTGKAAARLVESIKTSKATLACSDEVKAVIPESASTVHRCLGSIRGSATKFRHHRRNRIITDVMLVDEASMVNVALMRRLVDALPQQTRLILLGDMDQLSSVEAGAVLGDICNTGGARSFSTELAGDIESLTGEKLIVDAQSPKETGIWDCVTKLKKSYRFGPDSGIAELASAINAGDPSRALAAFDTYDELSLVMPKNGSSGSAPVIKSAVSGYESYLMNRGDARSRLQLFDEFRVLCVRRTGALGVNAINDQIEVALRKRGLIEADTDQYPGRPILVGTNNYQLDIYNGDIGLLLPGSEQPGANVRAYFVGPDGNQRMFSPSRLGPIQTVFAMSVHKSQGSEFGSVAIVLPDAPSPVLTREVLYTAVTRAKRSVAIYGSEAMLRHAILHQTIRTSGLLDALWGRPSA